MRIERGQVVKLDYELRDREGALLEDEGSQLEYLHGGYGGIFPKVEEALEGRDVGHEVKLTPGPVAPFGDYDAELLRVEPRARFPQTLHVGMLFEGIPREDAGASHIYPGTRLTPRT